MQRHSEQTPIYNHIKTARRPWLCAVRSWTLTSWMLGPVVERGNVATGHQIMKNDLAGKSFKSLCNNYVVVWLVCSVCVCACMCAGVRVSESGNTDVGSDGELDVWECKA